MADIFEPTITSFSNKEQDLEQRVTVLEGLVKQLDDLILKNSGFVPPTLVEAANSIEE